MSESIAVIGMSCRFPNGANDPEKYWELLASGTDAWSQVPTARWNEEAFYHPDAAMNGATNHRGGYFIDQNLDAFEPSFFGISGEEAKAMDPQQRIQLEIAYEALENAGIPKEALPESDTAVYVASFSRDYDRLMYKDISSIPKHHMVGTGDTILSNRISHIFDLRGPSMTIDTACSGSLVALHQACQSLRTCESSMTLVGASNLIISPDQLISMSLARFLNGDGRCYSFDDRRDGYGRGEGVAMVVLKRLSDALSAGDNIRSIIRNTGINQDGRLAGGITVPNPQAQAELIRRVYLEAKLNPRDTLYLEAHGTGTQQGDSAEFNSAIDVFGRDSSRTSLLMGSVKSNIGHLESASGLAGVIKTVLMFEKNLIPPTLHQKNPKPGLDYSGNNIKIPNVLESLDSFTHSVRRASINGFGYGGTNGHVILDPPFFSASSPSCGTWHSQSEIAQLDYDETNQRGTRNSVLSETRLKFERSDFHDLTQLHAQDNGSCTDGLTNGSITKQDHPPGFNTRDHKEIGSHHLLVLTARTENSLRLMMKNLYQWTEAREIKERDLTDLSFTLCTRRSLLPWRASFVINGPADLAPKLYRHDSTLAKASSGTRTMFVFTGQGSQWAGMGQGLFQKSSSYKRSIEKSDSILRHLGAEYSLVEELNNIEPESRINESWLAQPAVTALQIALVDLLKTLGVIPCAVLGHSSGEIAAAYASGSLSQHAALTISYHRGYLAAISEKLMDRKGAMLAVGLSEVDVCAYMAQIRNGLATVACINSPSSITVSGDNDAIQDLRRILDAKSIFNRLLKVDTAYHSHFMEKVSTIYSQSISDTEHKQTKIPFFSSVTTQIKSEGFDASYWVKNLVSPVRFSGALTEAVTAMSANGQSPVMVEIGPHGTLNGPIRQTLAAAKMSSSSQYLSALMRKESSIESVLTTLGRLFEIGYSVNLSATHKMGSCKGSCSLLKDLPPYPWDRANHYWHESRLSHDYRFRKYANHDLLGTRILHTTPSEPGWRHFISLDTHPWLADHVIEDAIIFPASGYLCMAIEGLKQIADEHGLCDKSLRFMCRDVSFLKTLVIPKDRSRVELMLSFRSEPITKDRTILGWEDFKVLSVTKDESWLEHCKGRIALEIDLHARDSAFEAERQYLYQRDMDLLNRVAGACSRTGESYNHYSECSAAGNVYDKTFHALEDVKVSVSSAIGKVVVPDIRAVMPHQFLSAHVIHPTTLDNILQIGLPMYHRKFSKEAVVPTYIDEMILLPDQNNAKGAIYDVACEFKPARQGSGLADFVAVQRDSRGQFKPAVIIHGQEFRGLGQKPLTSDTGGDRRSEPDVFRIEWKRDVAFSTTQQIFTVRRSDQVSAGSITLDEKYDSIYRLETLYIESAMKEIQRQSQACSLDPHQEKLLAWMNDYIKSVSCQEMLQRMSALEQDPASQYEHKLGVEGEGLARVGKILPKLLVGEIEPQAVLASDAMHFRLSFGESTTECLRHLQSFFKELTFKSPKMKVLEIGAGTGDTINSLLQALSTDSDSSFGLYDFTDTTSQLFAAAKTRLQDRAGFLSFKTLDIENDPSAQGFEESSYDVIIATNVVHATGEIDTTLKHIHQLLKPDGYFILIEPVKVPLPHMMVCSLFSDWWKDDDRDYGSILSAERWALKLSANKFSCQHSVNDFDGKAHISSLFVNTKIDMTERTVSPQVHILFDEAGDNKDMYLATQVLNQLQENNAAVDVRNWPSEHEIDDSIYIILDIEKDTRPLSTLSNLDRVILLLTTASRILWITSSSGSANIPAESHAIATGLIRTARSENSNLKATILTVRTENSSAFQHLPLVVSKLVTKRFLALKYKEDDSDLILDNGDVLIPRALPELRISHSKVLERKETTEMVPFHQDDQPLKLHVEKPGLLDALTFTNNGGITSNPLEPNEIQIQVFACGVNFKDIFVALGQMKITTEMVGECAGVIRQVGSNVPNTTRVGDRVLVPVATPYASMARAHHLNIIVIPNAMSFTTAASIPIIFGTAYEGLINIGRLQAGQYVMIPAGSGGVGQAAIQIAQHVGAIVFTTVSSATKRQLLIDRYGINPAHVFSSRSRGFKDTVMHLTKQRGVDVILNSTSGETLAEMWNCLAPFGTFVEIGKTDIYKRSNLDMGKFDTQTTFAAIDLSLMCKHKPARVNALLFQVMALFNAGHLKPVHPLTVLEIGQVEEAFRMVQARKHTGKIILDAQPGLMVKGATGGLKLPRLNQDGTYIIAGGLGNLAGHISRSMAKQGAGAIVLLSRRSLSTKAEERLRTEFNSLGAELYVMKVNITQQNTVVDAIEFCKSNLPPIRGIIQAAMILQDFTLTKMTIDAFRAALEPKIYGTRNLIQAVKGLSLDFFLLLSSMSSIIGPPGQANYSAANSYLDDLAQLANQSELRILSLNLGAVEDSEVIAGHDSIISNLLRSGMPTLKIEEFITLFEYLIKPETLRKSYKQLAFGVLDVPLANGDLLIDKHAIFRGLRNFDGHRTGLTANGGVQCVKNVLRSNMNATKIQDICQAMLRQKIANLMALDAQDLVNDRPIQELGMDSLITIEIKNWIAGEFQASLATSEISDAICLMSLTNLILARSLIAKDSSGKTLPNDLETKPVLNGPVLNRESRLPRVNGGLQQTKFPALPVPQLKNTLDFFEISVRQFCSSSERESLRQAIEEFLRPGSIGQTLQSRLLAKAKDASSNHWQHDLYVNFVYLRVRAPVNPFQTFSTWFMESNRHHKQAERAAIITLEAASFNRKLRAGLIEPDIMNNEPVDMSTSQWIFGSVRQPHVGLDVACKFDDTDYVVVLRKGHAFEVSLIADDGHIFGYGKIKGTFEAISSLTLDDTQAVAVLTGDDRDTWAKNRSYIQDNVSASNRSIIQTIEKATFIVCLDDEAPESSSECANHFFLSGSVNRWSDKLTQLIICSNGLCGITFEHSMIDGSNIGQLNQAIGQALLTNSPSIDSSENPAPFRHLKVNTDETVIQAVQQAQQMQKENALTYQCGAQSLTFDSFGNSFFRGYGCSGNVGLQLMLQLASRIVYGQDQPPSYETVGLRSFAGGRVDIAQTLQSRIKEWCEVAVHEFGELLARTETNVNSWAESRVRKSKSCFLAAAREHASNITRIARGQGFASHMYALQEMRNASELSKASSVSPGNVTRISEGDDEDLPSLFKPGSTFWRTRPRKLMTDTSSWLVLDGVENEAGYMMSYPESVYLHYDVRDNISRIFIKCPVGQLELIAQAIHTAVEIVKRVLHGNADSIDNSALTV